jgi:hypothetical protein
MKMHERFIRHATKFGIDGVADAAVEVGFTEDELTTLLVALDALEQKSKPPISRRHKTVDVKAICRARARKLLGIEDDDTKETDGK